MSVNLTSNAINDIINGKDISQPIIQIINIKPLNPTSQERFRAFISDGIHHTGCAMFGTQLNEKVKSNAIDTYAIIKLLRYVCNTINAAKKIIIILECEVLVSGVDIGEIIGSPILLNDASTTAKPSTQNAAPTNSTSMTSMQETSIKPNVAVHPIASLTPYQNKWTICARVTNKSSIRTWSNSRGEGKLFSVDLLDESGEIRATGFNEQCDKFYNLLEVDKVYYIGQGQLKTANKQYSSLKNDYEMSFSNATQISPCHEETSIPVMQFEFVNIEQLENMDKDQIIDTIGICKNVEEIVSLTQKSTGKELKKRDIQLVDDSNKEIKLTLWGSQAENFDGSLMPVIAVKGVKVSDFNGKSLSVISTSVLQINPDIREAHKIRAWYDNFGSSLETVNLSSQRGTGFGMGANMKTIGQAVAEGLGAKDTAEYYSTKATTTLLKSENCLYAACPSETCNKKVIDQNNGIYRCEKCNRDYDNFKWRLMLQCNIADCTDNVWVTMFQDQAETLLDCSAHDLASKKDMDTDDYQTIFQNSTFKEFVFKLRVKMETYNDENRLKTSVMSVVPVNYTEYNQKLCEEIKTLSQN